MLLATVFDQFVEDSPLTVMARALLEHALQPGPIDDMFERTATVQYTDKLLFSTVVDMMGMVVCGFADSPHAVYLSRPELFPVALANVYEKLNGIELPVMQNLVRDNTAQLSSLWAAPCQPSCRAFGSRSWMVIASRARNTASRSCVLSPLPLCRARR